MLGLALGLETVRVHRGALVTPASELVVLLEEPPAPAAQRLGWEADAQCCLQSGPAAAARSAARPAPVALVGVQVSAVKEVPAGPAYEPEVLLHP